MLERQVISGTAGASYVPGLMALRLGPLMEEAVRALSDRLTCCCSMPLPMIIREEPAWRCTWAPSWTFPQSA